MRKRPALIERLIFLAILVMGVLIMVNPAFSNERVIDLDGTANTRDIGGYLTDDHAHPCAGDRLFAPINLSRLTANDFQQARGDGRENCHRFAHRERARPGTYGQWLGDKPPEFFHFPVGDVQ